MTEETPKIGDVWYRYVDDQRIDAYNQVKMHVSEVEYRVVKVTLKGVWLIDDEKSRYGYVKSSYGFIQGKRFVLTAARVRFAYPTKQLAIESYIARKKSQIDLCLRRAELAEAALNIAKVIQMDPSVRPYATVTSAYRLDLE
jgi:hypothetical protein